MSKAQTETAVIYCRQSFTNDKDSQSIADQQKKATEYAKQHKIKILGTAFIDENTASELYPNTDDCRHIAERDKTFKEWLKEQKRFERFVIRNRIPYKEQLGRCFDFIAENKPTYLIVWSFERLGRSESSSCLQPCITDFLKHHNVKLIETKNGTITDYNNSNDQLLALIKSHIEYEGLKTKKRSSMNVIANRIKDSRAVSNAYGVVTDRRNKEIKFNAEKAEVIRYIYNAIISGKSYAEILFNLNTIYEKQKTKGAKCFYESSIYHIASNPIYCGMMKYMENGSIHLKPAVNIPEPIISVDLFYAVQKNMELRKNRCGKAHYNTSNTERKVLPLSGLLYCGNCGSRLTVIYDKGKTCYRCHKYDIMHRPQCKESRIRVDFADRRSGLYDVVKKLFVISFITEMRSKYDVDQKNAEAAEMQTEIENEKQKITAIFAQLKTEKSLDFLREELSQWSAEISSKDEKLKKIQEKNRVDQNRLEQEVNELYNRIENNEELEEGLFFNLARKTLKKVIVYADKIHIILMDDNEFELPRLMGSHKSKYLPISQVKVAKIHGNGEHMIDWVKRFHLTYGIGKKHTTLVSTEKYIITLLHD